MRHAQVGREIVGRLVGRNRAQHVARLALQQLEQLFAGPGELRDLPLVVCPEHADGVGSGAEVSDHAVQACIVQAECRHAYFQPWPNGNRPLDERVQPIGLHLGAFGRQQRRRERRVANHFLVLTAIAFDFVAAHTVLAPHERAARYDVVAVGGPRRQRRRRLDIALEAHDRRLQPFVFHFAGAKIGHAQFLERFEHTARIERARILDFLMEPRELVVVLDRREGEIEPRHQLGALFRQLRADRLHGFEAFDLVTTETAVARDDAPAKLLLLGIRVHLRQLSLRLGQRHHIAQIVEQHIIGLLRCGCRLSGHARRAGERRQKRGDVGDLRVREAQVRHIRVRVVMLRIAHPVVEPDIRGLAADVLQRLPERAPRPGLGAIFLIEHVAAQASNRADDLFAALRIALPWCRHSELVRLCIREQIRHRRVDLDFIPRGILRRAAVRVVPNLRHPGDFLHRTRIADPGFHPVGRQLTVDLRENRPGLAHVLEPFCLVTRVAACALIRGVRQRQLRRIRHVDLAPMALLARRLGHRRGQHRVVPHVRLFPPVPLFPVLALLVVARIVHGVDEARSAAHALMAHGAANLVRGVR